jgi:DNA-binding NarL/FixJ family response regulator
LHPSGKGRASYGRKEKVILLEPIPAKHDITSKLINFGLTKREQEIAVMATRGLANREIADRLFICEQTVKDHLRRIFEKMKIRHRSELAARVIGIDITF